MPGEAAFFTPGATEAIALAVKGVFAGADAHRVEKKRSGRGSTGGIQVEVNQGTRMVCLFLTVPRPACCRSFPGFG